MMTDEVACRRRQNRRRSNSNLFRAVDCFRQQRLRHHRFRDLNAVRRRGRRWRTHRFFLAGRALARLPEMLEDALHDELDMFSGEVHGSAIPITAQRIGVLSFPTMSRTAAPSVVSMTV